MNRNKTDVLKLNIQEQVQYLTDRYQAEQGMVSWGIRVIDRVDTADELDDTEKFDPTTLQFGDAVAVGTESPFFFYIWTRTSTDPNAGYWFPFGEIATPGPQGPPGESIVGPEGPRGTKWFTTPNQPTLNEEVKDGDIYLDQNGNVKQATTYSNETRAWVYVTNIRGATGIGNPGPAPIISNNGQYITSTNPQTGVTTNVISLDAIKGSPGERGPAGGLINIRGVLAQGPLPTPVELNDLSAAYLIGSTTPYTLWIQVGSSPATAQWRDAGPFNTATAVSVGGVYQSAWNADTKVDKKTVTAEQILTLKPNGTTDSLSFNTTAAQWNIVRRDGSAQIEVVENPTANNHAVSKKYVDHEIDGVAPTGDYWAVVYFNGTSRTFKKAMGSRYAYTPDAYVGAMDTSDQEYILLGYSDAMDWFVILDIADHEFYTSTNYILAD